MALAASHPAQVGRLLAVELVCLGRRAENGRAFSDRGVMQLPLGDSEGSLLVPGSGWSASQLGQVAYEVVGEPAVVGPESLWPGGVGRSAWVRTHHRRGLRRLSGHTTPGTASCSRRSYNPSLARIAANSVFRASGSPCVVSFWIRSLPSYHTPGLQLQSAR